MKKTAAIILAGFSLFLIQSCSKQNPVEVDAGVFSSLSGRIENWSYGSGYSASFLRMVITAETSPDVGTIISIGNASIDIHGGFSITEITAPPDTLYNIGGRMYNIGLFGDYPVFFHGYTNPSISVVEGSNNFIGYLVYGNQPKSVLPYTGNTAEVGDFSMMYQYSDRTIQIDTATTGTTINDMVLKLTYHMSLKKGWNRIYVITTYVSTTERRAIWTTDTPNTPGQWYMVTRYFKGKQNLFN